MIGKAIESILSHRIVYRSKYPEETEDTISEIRNNDFREKTLKTLNQLYGSENACLIYGLRRTGKTTMLMQAISELPKDKTAYIKIMTTDSMANLNHDLKLLSGLGYQYVFIDEVTLLKDFIDGASLFSDVYAMFGMKIVLSGTDSLGFAISADEELYDRAVTIHTTFIPFRE